MSQQVQFPIRAGSEVAKQSDEYFGAFCNSEDSNKLSYRGADGVVHRFFDGESPFVSPFEIQAATDAADNFELWTIIANTSYNNTVQINNLNIQIFTHDVATSTTDIKWIGGACGAFANFIVTCLAGSEGSQLSMGAGVIGVDSSSNLNNNTNNNSTLSLFGGSLTNEARIVAAANQPTALASLAMIGRLATEQQIQASADAANNRVGLSLANDAAGLVARVSMLANQSAQLSNFILSSNILATDPKVTVETSVANENRIFSENGGLVIEQDANGDLVLLLGAGANFALKNAGITFINLDNATDVLSLNSQLIQIPNLTSFADNAAALGGGLVAGDCYVNTGTTAGSGLLAVVI